MICFWTRKGLRYSVQFMTRGKRKRLCLGEQDESKSEIIVPQNSVNTFVSSAIFGTGESF